MKTRVLKAAICLFIPLNFGYQLSAQSLTHGPVVGGVTDSGANVFVRTDQVATVAVRYSTDPTFETFQTSQSFTTDADSDFTKIIPISGLTAESTYYMNVLINNVPRILPPYPSFKTFAPKGSARDFNFAVLTDFTNTHSLRHSVQTFANAAATKPAFVFIGGDFDHRNPKILDAKRKMFKDLYDPTTPYMDGFVGQILNRFAIVHQWDDHDAGENNLDKNYLRWGVSQQAFEEYIPTYPLPAVIPGIWQSFSYAQADFFVLDCRSQRDPETDPDNRQKSMLDGNNLGTLGQLRWLKAGLSASKARWKIIFSSVITNPTTKYPDGWAGYQTEWNALRKYITSSGITGVVFISGDLHLGAIDDGTAAGFPEMCVAQPNGNETGGCATSDLNGIWSEGYYEDTCTGFGIVSVSATLNQLTLQYVDQYGNVRISLTVN